MKHKKSNQYKKVLDKPKIKTKQENKTAKKKKKN